MVANPEKFQLIFFELKEDHELSIEVNGDVIKMSDTVKLLVSPLTSNLDLTSMLRLSAKRQTTTLKLIQGL